MIRDISRDDLKGKIEQHFWSSLVDERFNVEVSCPRELLSFNRLDLAIKVFFLEYNGDCPDFVKTLYAEHLKCFTLGSFREPGNSQKTSLESYLRDFETIRQSVADNGFDTSKTIIPLGTGGTILNGAHRIAAAICSDASVSTVRLPVEDSMYDYRFFLQRGMSQSSVEAAVTKFVELQPNCYLACVWPRADGRNKELDDLFNRVVYKTSFRFSYRGAHNLLAQVYAGEDWLGSSESGFGGARGKLVECFPGSGDLRVYAFQADSLDDVLALKEKVRELFNVGKHSVHITDTHEEATRIARLLFNENGRHFLEFGNPHAYQDTYKIVQSFNALLDEKGVSRQDVILDSGIVLALYGLRATRDLDYLSLTDLGPIGKDTENHDSELRHHGKKTIDLLADSRCYFYYQDLKFVALPQLARMKRSRLEEKDVKDLKLMTPLLQNNGVRFSREIIQSLLFLKARFRRLTLLILKKIALYELAKKTYRWLRGVKSG